MSSDLQAVDIIALIALVSGALCCIIVSVLRLSFNVNVNGVMYTGAPRPVAGHPGGSEGAYPRRPKVRDALLLVLLRSLLLLLLLLLLVNVTLCNNKIYLYSRLDSTSIP